MACACKGRKNAKYVWTPPADSGLDPVTYDSEIQAKAKVMRKGGSYKTITG